MPVSAPDEGPSLDDLREFVGATTDSDDVLARCLSFGASLVAKYTQRVTAGGIPNAVLNEAILAASADQFNRRQAPNGILNQQFTGPNGEIATAIRISRDPFASVRPMLSPWVKSGTGSVKLTSSLDATT